MIFDLVGDTIRSLGTNWFYNSLKSLLEEAISFDNYLVIGYQGEHKPIILSQSSHSNKVHADLESRYVKSLYVLDPFYSTHMRKVAPGAYRLRDISPDKFRSTSYFLEYYKKTTILDEIAFIAYVENEWTINVCIGRDETSGTPFSKGTLRQAREISLCVCSLLERHFGIAKLPSEEGLPILNDKLITQLRNHHGVSITQRQAQVAILLLRGHSSKSIAEELQISWQTVRVFRKQLYARCGASSQAELFALLMPLMHP